MSVIGREPFGADIVLVSGDSLSELLVEGEDALPEDAQGNPQTQPADFTGVICSMQVRPAARSSQIFLDLDNTFFFLGSSKEANDWDVANLKPIGTTKDQIFIRVDPPLTEIVPGEWEYDLEIKGPGSSTLTKVKGVFEVLEDVTRAVN